mmetsp:Transcript_27382/g.82166  ORF Transcript_27382/g.82166 Transcript_27382/m.82166 type:complete len:297 (-) Transcript_27382:37-927(-)
MPRSLSFETTIRVSTSRSRASIASDACRDRLRPSKPKGFVTTPIVRAPALRAASATTTAAPEPVPPPMPAVTKTRSAPRTIASTSSRDSSAAARPTRGSPPAPRPRVSTRPICSPNVPGRDAASACASVFTVQNSTPRIDVSTIRFTALQPPPPIPITLMLHGRSSGRVTASPLDTAAVTVTREAQKHRVETATIKKSTALRTDIIFAFINFSPALKLSCKAVPRTTGKRLSTSLRPLHSLLRMTGNPGHNLLRNTGTTSLVCHMDIVRSRCHASALITRWFHRRHNYSISQTCGS